MAHDTWGNCASCVPPVACRVKHEIRHSIEGVEEAPTVVEDGCAWELGSREAAARRISQGALTTHYSLLTTHCLLHLACRILLTTHYSLLTASSTSHAAATPTRSEE
eukprot:3925993-Prymnesium_polylepis.1